MQIGQVSTPIDAGMTSWRIVLGPDSSGDDFGALGMGGDVDDEASLGKVSLAFSSPFVLSSAGGTWSLAGTAALVSAMSGGRDSSNLRDDLESVSCRGPPCPVP